MNEFKLDKTDIQILRLLQLQARASFDELASQVGLSSSAVLRRVKRLENEGIILDYRATILPEAIDIGLTAYISVRLEKQSSHAKNSPREMFRSLVQSWSEVVSCVSLAGEMDYMLRVVVRDMAHFSRFLSDKLLRHEIVRDCRTSFVLEWVKEDKGLPL